MSDRYEDLAEYNWLAEQVDFHETEQAMALGKLILDKFGPKSVIDIGCSSGIYLVPFKEAGMDYLGIDGAPGVGKWAMPNFQVVDLRQPWTPPHRFDLALCIEVLEHIKPEFADTVVDTIVKCAPLAFVSAAHVGQGGEGHYNEQPFSYWQEKFVARGFIFDQGLTDTLKAVIDIEPVYDHCHWLRWHSWIFREA